MGMESLSAISGMRTRHQAGQSVYLLLERDLVDYVACNALVFRMLSRDMLRPDVVLTCGHEYLKDVCGMRAGIS